MTSHSFKSQRSETVVKDRLIDNVLYTVVQDSCLICRQMPLPTGLHHEEHFQNTALTAVAFLRVTRKARQMVVKA